MEEKKIDAGISHQIRVHKLTVNILMKKKNRIISFEENLSRKKTHILEKFDVKI